MRWQPSGSRSADRSLAIVQAAPGTQVTPGNGNSSPRPLPQCERKSGTWPPARVAPPASAAPGARPRSEGPGAGALRVPAPAPTAPGRPDHVEPRQPIRAAGRGFLAALPGGPRATSGNKAETRFRGPVGRLRRPAVQVSRGTLGTPGRDRNRHPQARASSGDWAVGAPGGSWPFAGLRPLLRALGPPSTVPPSPLLACPGPPWGPGCPQRGPRSRPPWGLPLPLVGRPAFGGALGPGLAAPGLFWWSLPGRTLVLLQPAGPRPRLALPRSCSVRGAVARPLSRLPRLFFLQLIFPNFAPSPEP